MIIKLKYFIVILLSFFTLAFLSCDDGRIYEEDYLPDTSGKVMKLTATISGMDSWAKGYSLVLAGFDKNEDYAIITKPVPFPKEDKGEVELIMSGIPQDVTTLHLCVVNRQRELVHSYAEIKCDPNEKDTIRMEGIQKDVNMFDVVQAEVFSDEEYGCTKCHGETGSFAGGVNLLKGHSYDCLINKKSNVAGQDTTVITPGNADVSTLYLILGTKYGERLRYPHSNILINSYANISLIRDWINNGAKEK